MNNPSPFVPQGSFEEQKNKGRARAKIAVFFVLAIHGIGLMALLMQGCRQEKPAPPEEQQPTNAAPATPDTNAPPVDTNAPPTTQPTNPPAAPEVVTPPVPTPPVPDQPQQPAASSDYTIVKGDTPAGIAKKNHVSTKELMGANPGLEPTKLKVGQKIHLPAAGASTPGAAGTASPTETPAAAQSYAVKSGDTLSKIATQHGTSIKALRAANHLKTDKIHVGDKLKIPAKAAKAQAATTSSQSVATPPSGQ
jgi:LysM repeat protein